MYKWFQLFSIENIARTFNNMMAAQVLEKRKVHVNREKLFVRKILKIKYGRGKRWKFLLQLKVL